MAVVGTAEVLVRPTFSGFQKSVNKQLGGLGPQGEQVGQSLGSRVSGGFKKAAAVGMAAAGGVVAAGLGAALTKGLGRLTAIENAQAKMRGLGHDAKTVDTIMANALTSVKGTAFGLGEAATIAASAVAAGIEPGDKLAGHLTRVANNAAAAGISMEEMGGIFNRAATQANGVQNDVISQLADRGIPIYQALADQMGVTAGEVFKLASEGKVDFETFSAAAEQAAGTVAKEMGGTLTGSLSNAWAALGRVGANLLSGVFDKFAPAIQGATGWLEKLEPVAKKVGEAIGDFATRVVNGMQGLIGQFREGEGAGGRLRDILTGIRDAAMAGFDYIRTVAVPVITGFVEQFRNGEGAGGKFRDVLAYIYEQGKLAFNWFRDEGLPALQAVWGFVVNSLVPDLRAGFIDRILPAMVELGGMIKRQWETVIKPALEALWKFVRDVLAPFLVDFYENGVKPTFKLIGDAIAGAWNNVIKPTFESLKEGGNSVKERFVTVKDGIQGAWERVTGIIEAGWNTVKGIFDKFKDGLNSLRDRFRSIRDGIADIWRGLTNAIARPINAVIDKVNAFLSALKDGLNKIPGVDIKGNWSIRKIILDTASGTIGGGPNQMLAAGGRVAGFSPHDRADNIPAMLTAGEYVLPVRATRSLASRFGPGFLEQLRRGLPGYADGGRAGGRRGGPGILESAGDFISGLWENAKDWIGRLWRRLMPDFGGSWAGMVGKGVLSSLDLSGLAAWIKDKFASTAGGGGVNYPGPYGQHPTGMHYTKIWDLIKSVVPDAIMTSGKRGPGLTASGIPSLHGLGRAVDWIIPNMFNRIPEMIAAFRRVGAIMPWSQHFFTQAGAGSQHGFVDDIIRRTHRDHAHTALADGGFVRPLVADAGAVLTPGLNVLNNRTGGPEPLIRADHPITLSDESLDKLAARLDRHARSVSARTVADHAVLTARRDR